MTGPFISTQPALSRRKFLRGAGILLSLPLLNAMTPVFAGVARSAANAALTPGGKPRRMFGICNNLGLVPDQFFPKQSGRDYALSPCLEALKECRNDFTVFSGVSHPEVDGGIRRTTASSPPRRIRAAPASATPSRSTNTLASASGISRASRRSRSA